MTLKAYKPSSLLLAVALLAALALPQIAAAQPPASPPGAPPEHAGPPQDVVDDLLARGFRRVEPAVFQRPVDGNRSFETLAFGADGLDFILRQYEAQLQILQERDREDPRAGRFEAILALEELVGRTRETLTEERRKEADAAAGNLMSGGSALRSVASALKVCDTTLHRLVRASRGTLGPEADCEASYDDTCSDTGNAYCFSHAEGCVGAICNETNQTCDLPGTTAADCASSVTVEGTTDCYSNAIAQVQFNTLTDDPQATGNDLRLLVTLSLGETNNVCRNLQVSLSGPTSVSVPAGSSQQVTWTASASDGDGSYTYHWRYNGVLVKSGTSKTYSRTYIHPGSSGTFTDTVQVTARDGGGETATDALSVTVTYGGTTGDCLRTGIGALGTGGSGNLVEPPPSPWPCWEN